jgi:hypothetical protein
MKIPGAPPEGSFPRFVMPAQAGIQGRGVMDTGLRRYDGTESRYRRADHRCTRIFEGGTVGAKKLSPYLHNLNPFVSFVPSRSIFSYFNDYNTNLPALPLLKPL